MYIRRLVASFLSRRWPGFDPSSSHSHVRWRKWDWGKLSPSSSLSLAHYHPINCSTFTNHCCLLLRWRIRLSGLYPFRINLKLWILQTTERTPWTENQHVAHNTNTGKPRYSSMTRVGFELTIAMFERAKALRALDRAATVNDLIILSYTL
jgi:hypothetical protein